MTAQITMGFMSPEIQSHTFPERIGAWNSTKWCCFGTIHTVDGRVLECKAKIHYTLGLELGKFTSDVVASINGEEVIVETPICCSSWFNVGDHIAHVLSHVAIGQKPALFADAEEIKRRKSRDAKKQERKEMRKFNREMNKRLKEQEQATA